ncbi:hypothetical protein D3C85_1055610 [compost metagenome]
MHDLLQALTVQVPRLGDVGQFGALLQLCGNLFQALRAGVLAFAHGQQPGLALVARLLGSLARGAELVQLLAKVVQAAVGFEGLA